MKGAFTCAAFDLTATRMFVGELIKAQLSIEIEWLEKLEEATVGTPDSVRISVRNEPVLSLHDKAGYVDTEMMTKDEERRFLAVFKRYRFIQAAPNVTAAWGWFAVYLVLMALAQAYWRSAASALAGSWFLPVLTGAMLSLVVTTVVLAVRSRKTSQRHNLAWYALLIGPGFVLTSPAALLVMPLIRVGTRQRLYEALHKDTAESSQLNDPAVRAAR